MTDRRLPPAALGLGLAGLVPFVWAAATHLSPALAGWGATFLSPLYLGAYLGLTWGTMILAFMSGALWGFAAKGDAGPLPYALSVIPALWVFFAVTDGTDTSTILLIAGFVGLLLIDATFAAQGLTPRWWMPLRLILTAVVVACLAGTLL
ncbi:MAG: DUF3429 domain-containing protein [Paracoccaceae bacterium]|jgi:hypothetical protein